MSVWWIDARLALQGGPARRLAGREWLHQVWPPCPVCHCMVHVERIDVTAFGDIGAHYYIPGDWECPNGCDPRGDTEAEADPPYWLGLVE